MWVGGLIVFVVVLVITGCLVFLWLDLVWLLDGLVGVGLDGCLFVWWVGFGLCCCMLLVVIYYAWICVVITRCVAVLCVVGCCWIDLCWC